jgi:serine-protein kinase ATM
MVDKDELRAPVALDYINTLMCIVSRQAHMDHLEDDLWVRMMELGFNVVLGDSLRRPLDEEDEEEETGIASRATMEDEDMDQDEDDDDDDELPSTSTLLSSKKRRRPTPRATTSKSQSKSKPKPKLPRQTSPEQRAFTTLLAFLLRAPSAPLLSPAYPHLPTAILSRLHRFLSIYPTDTSLHEDYLIALSATLSHLSLNKKRDVENFALGAWDGLVGLWGTKTKRLKEGLVSVLRVLFPFVTADRENPSWGQGVGKLWRLLDGEAESRWGVDGMSFECLRLEVQRDGDTDGRDAFVKKTFRAGWHFDAAQALAWAILELQADCAEKVTTCCM